MPFKKLFFPLLGYALACAAYTLCTGDPLGFGLVWNIGLALLPLPLLEAARRRKHMAARWALRLAWLLLLPNTFYMVTDLIHVPANMEWVEPLANGGAVVRHSPFLREWALLLLIGTGAFFAAAFGCRALERFELSLPASVGKWGRRASVAALSLLCGLGTYIGRFLRFNSWDILKPVRLLRTLWENMSVFSILFILWMAFAVFLLYHFYRWLCGPGEK